MYNLAVGGAGGAPSEGVIYSLLKENRDKIIGFGADPTDLILSLAPTKVHIPFANNPNYQANLLRIITKLKIDYMHFQNDFEILTVSRFRDDILSAGVRLFMPNHDVIETCVDKFKSWNSFKQAGIKVPENILIRNKEDLMDAFNNLGNSQGEIWLRSTDVSGGGKGSIATSEFDMAKSWIEHYSGWGSFVAAEKLSNATVTWMSIWWEGRLIVAQTRKRFGWIHSNRSISGVTGVTKVGVTINDPFVDEVAQKSVFAVSRKPHGIFGVDMTFDDLGVPNPTEINISRFFTTIRFFTEAGINFPSIAKNLSLYNEFPKLTKHINPLPEGLMWLRGMDTEPKLIKKEDFEVFVKNQK
jgi:hypothetical protein